MAKGQAKVKGAAKKPAAKSNGRASSSKGVRQSGMPVFYEQPEMLDSERHEGLQLKPVVSYEFSANVNAIPITAAEFPAVARDYPIVFTAGKNPGATALVGLRKGENLMVDKKGAWLRGSYIPAYVRRYPFIFTRVNDTDQYTLCIERTCKQLAKGNKSLLFEGGEMSALTKKAMEFCKVFQQQHIVTGNAIKILKEHDLLSPGQRRFKLPDGRSLSIVDFLTIDEKKFNELSDEAFLAIRKSGLLPTIYCHLISMGSWHRLVERFHALNPAAQAEAQRSP